MKHILGIIVLFSFLISCNEEGQKTSHHSGEVITELIIYDVPIVNDSDSKLPAMLNNIEGSGQLNYQQQILLNAENGTYKIYKDMDGNEEIEYSMVIAQNTTSDTTWLPSSTPGEDSMSVITTTIGAPDITKIRFLEKWTFSKDKSQIFKEVIGFAPIRSQYAIDPWTGKNTLLGERILFWVRYDK